MDKRVAECDPVPLDRAFAVKWYAEGWIDCWNSNRPQRVRDILTEDFVLDSPTTRHTGWHVQGYQATMDYIRYVLTAYPDPATGGDPWTIGVGHTSAAGAPNVVKGMKFHVVNNSEFLGYLIIQSTEPNEATGVLDGPGVERVHTGDPVKTQLQ